MAKRWIAKMFLVLTIATAAAALSSTSAAAPSPTPNGYTGACNMLADATMLTTPMAVDAAQGNAGMSTAVARSGSGC
jgi:hypothetical protein